MKKIIQLIIVIGFTIFTQAQERTISGIVSDEMGPVADISVKVKGTAKGTITDFDGNYTIKAKTGDILEFSHISYITVNKKVKNSSIINVLMKENNDELSEVVITAYGAKRSKKKTVNSLVGKISGIKVTSSSKSVGSSSRIVLRGSSIKESSSKSKSPLGKIDKVISSNHQSGQITAAEWNDLENWDFWKGLLTSPFSEHQKHWKFYTQNRVSVIVKDKLGNLIQNAVVSLKKGEKEIWTAKTDNFGKASLWIDLFNNTKRKLSNYSLYINQVKIIENVKKENIAIITDNSKNSNKVEVAFIVDATGSMSDELEFLKTDLQSVIKEVQSNNINSEIVTASVFYRDKGDDYVVKKSDFTKKLKSTIDFIKAQSADGGGDFPEAVHTALKTAINELEWSKNAKTKIAFLLLDAPPHYDDGVINQIHKTIIDAAKKGIKIIPITASGINKSTEFLMRFMAISTNGTYVFITNDSGIGNNHIKSSTGDYKVEILKKLIIRLINKYSNNNN